MIGVGDVERVDTIRRALCADPRFLPAGPIAGVVLVALVATGAIWWQSGRRR